MKHGPQEQGMSGGMLLACEGPARPGLNFIASASDFPIGFVNSDLLRTSAGKLMGGKRDE